MEQNVEFLMDVHDPDLEGPYSIIILYLTEDPNSGKTSTILSHDAFHLYEDPDEAFDDWSNVMPPQQKIDHLRKRFGITDIYIEISLYDTHNCEIAVANFKWEDDEQNRS